MPSPAAARPSTSSETCRVPTAPSSAPCSSIAVEGSTGDLPLPRRAGLQRRHREPDRGRDSGRQRSLWARARGGSASGALADARGRRVAVGASARRSNRRISRADGRPRQQHADRSTGAGSWSASSSSGPAGSSCSGSCVSTEACGSGARGTTIGFAVRAWPTTAPVSTSTTVKRVLLRLPTYAYLPATWT